MANYRTIGTDFSEGLRAPHYTNGRLLTAEDLQDDQRIQLERLAQTGQAAGHGIIQGFDVTAVTNKTALRITAGLGLNRKGYAVHLAAPSVTLPVQPVVADEIGLHRSKRFENCSDPEGDQPTTTTSGAYLLTAAPLSKLEGSIPRKTCDGTGTSTCANQWEVEGVEFKIIHLKNYTPPTGNRANRNRNLLAHWFYGSEALVTLMRDPLQFDVNYSGYSQIAAEDYDLCDLPLAVFYWEKNKISFIDQWAVRRRMTHPYPTTAWAANLSDRRVAEGEARFLQFQQQIADLQTTYGNNTDNLRAVDRFAYLPPVGILPINPFELIATDVFYAALDDSHREKMKALGLTEQQVLSRVRTSLLNEMGDPNAFNLVRFFGEFLPPEYSIVHEDLIHNQLHQSWVQPPIQLPPPSIQEGLFDLKLSDGTLVTVDDNNFEGILNNLHSRFSGTIFNYAAERTALGAEDTAANFGRNILGRLPTNTMYRHPRFKPPREVFNPTKDDDDKVEPLIDILVVDELLDPYRDKLASQMQGRIDDAISTLSSTSGRFTAINNFGAINNSIANAFVLNEFLYQGSRFGKVDFDKLFELLNRGRQPIFYVVFTRYRPPEVTRPLRL